MYAEARKLYIIEEVLKINSDATLSALEDFVNQSKKNKSSATEKKTGFSQFSGIWSKEEAAEIEQIIAGSCENIHADDWK